MIEIKRYNMHYVQQNPDEYWQPYAVQNDNGEWCQWNDVLALQHKLEITTEALRNIVNLGDISGIAAENALREIEELSE